MEFNVLNISAIIPFVLLILAALSKIKKTNFYFVAISEYVLGFSAIFSSYELITVYLSNSPQFLNIAYLDGFMRYDTLSLAMFLMISIIGFIVIRYSKTYLKGDIVKIKFHRRLLTTIALIQILVLSGNIFVLLGTWILSSISLQYLISSQKSRKEALSAARKKFIVARFSDISLLVAVILIYQYYGSGDLEYIISNLKNIQDLPLVLELAAVFVVFAAIIKSVQIPFHGWILEVMEAPTPVSSLLHAGLINAGPFLIIRFAYLIDISAVAPILLLIIGGVSALYGTIVFPAQTAVKTSLAYSSIGHMGFSLMVSGMGLYSVSLLHLVAHSFYKAHSFLSSGSAIDRYRTKQLWGLSKIRLNKSRALFAFIVNLLLYISFAWLFGVTVYENLQLLIVGIIIISGVSVFMAGSISLNNEFTFILRSMMVSALVLIAFFFFEGASHYLLMQQIPEDFKSQNTIQNIISISLLLLFVLAVVMPTLIQQSSEELRTKWNVYRRNGFYVHIIFDRFVYSLFSGNHN